MMTTMNVLANVILIMCFNAGVMDSEPEDKRELSSLGMGTKRSLQAYMEFAGLDLRNEKIEHRCDSWFDWENNKWVHI